MRKEPNQLTGTVQYAEKAKTAVVSPANGTTLCYLGGTINNRAAASNIVAATKILHTSQWKAGQWDDSAGASYTDDTTDAQSGTSNAFALTTTTDNDGFVVQAMQKFNIISIDVTTAAAGGSPVYAYYYWNGSAWTAITNVIEVLSLAATGEKTVAFAAPASWTALAAGDTPVATDGLTAGYYPIFVKATTAPTSTAGLASKLYIAKIILNFKEAAADNDVLNFNYDDAEKGYPLLAGEAIGAYFQTAHNDNAVDFRYYVKG